MAATAAVVVVSLVAGSRHAATGLVASTHLHVAELGRAYLVYEFAIVPVSVRTFGGTDGYRRVCGVGEPNLGFEMVRARVENGWVAANAEVFDCERVSAAAATAAEPDHDVYDFVLLQLCVLSCLRFLF